MRRICVFTPRLCLALVPACTLALAQNNDLGPLLAVTAHNLKADLRVNVNMTLVPVTVLDSMGRSVTGLTPQNFRVFDDSHRMPIASFSRQDQPAAVGLVLDCSRSMTNKFLSEREAPRSLFRQLGPGDQSFLVTISNHAQLRFPLTSDFDSILNALLFTHPMGATALLDGVQQGLAELRKSRLVRKGLIVVSDGGDNSSRYTLHEIDQLAAESGAQIFTILLYKDPGTREEYAGPDLMQHLAGESGGINFLIHKMEDIDAVMAKIGISLHNQYLLGYYTPEGVRSGQYRKIAVELVTPAGTPHLYLRARPGYYAP
jgi:Ca-activated chloride channel family protein